ncbi:hypothetical protein [Halococcus agarilyticus]|uniref:hypothetical protein n=1 Tax=Halococcus agarilyticus TaxID=1232219 RepID=UPI0006782D28|nr:hypothetical protein [Halococcus agarilyticus]
MPLRDSEFDPTTRAEFETLVETLVHAAHDNHIDPDGGIDVRHPSTDVPDWTVEITEIEKRRRE